MPEHVFEIGDRVSRIGRFAGITGTVIRHDKTVQGDPLVWVRIDGQAPDSFPQVFQPHILAPIHQAPPADPIGRAQDLGMLFDLEAS